MRKAIDQLKHNVSLNGLQYNSLPEHAIDTLGYMLNNTVASVVFYNIESESWQVGNGTRQRSVWSPLFFCFYTNKVMWVISQMNMGCSLNIYKSDIIGCAYDYMY